MRYFFVDYENVGQKGLFFGTSHMSDSSVHIFYTDKCANINLSVIGLLLNEQANIQIHYAEHGTKNALDFQLVSYLGYIVSETGGNGEYIIVSNDQGYDVVAKFWNKNGTHVARSSNMVMHPLDDVFDESDESDETEGTDESAVSDTNTVADPPAIVEEKPVIPKALNMPNNPDEVPAILDAKKEVKPITEQQVMSAIARSKRNAVFYKNMPVILRICNQHATKAEIHNACIDTFGKNSGLRLYCVLRDKKVLQNR